MEVPVVVPRMPRLPRPKLTLVREVPKPKKDKQKRQVPVCESLREHATTQAQRKEKLSAKEKGKVVDMEAEGVQKI